MVSFTSDEFKGRSASRALLVHGIKRADRTPIPTKAPSKPMSWSHCPADAVNLKWAKVGQYFRAKYRQGILVNRDGHYTYIPNEAN